MKSLAKGNKTQGIEKPKLKLKNLDNLNIWKRETIKNWKMR